MGVRVMRVYERPAQILRPDIDPARRVLVVSDIHANIPYFDGVLSRAGFCDDDILIIDGDFLEKGTQSLEMLHRVMELSSRENVYTSWATVMSGRRYSSRHKAAGRTAS